MRSYHERSSNRFEIKYLVPHEAIAGLLDDLAAYVYPDPNWRGEWGYPVHSVYWDSDRLVLFWEKIEGLKHRRKLRFRRYSDGSQIFIEIKQRTDRTLQKRRTLWPQERVLSHFGSDPDSERPFEGPEDAVASEALWMRHRYGLRPRMAISYLRRAYFGRYEPDLRVTFDRRVVYRRPEADLPEPIEAGRYLVDPRLVIMEIKFSDRVPAWLCKLASGHGLQMTRLSKYCTAIDRAYYGHTLT